MSVLHGFGPGADTDELSHIPENQFSILAGEIERRRDAQRQQSLQTTGKPDYPVCERSIATCLKFDGIYPVFWL